MARRRKTVKRKRKTVRRRKPGVRRLKRCRICGKKTFNLRWHHRKHPIGRRNPGGHRVGRGGTLVSKKIHLLLREGYPQRQAIAIALRMYGLSRKKR